MAQALETALRGPLSDEPPVFEAALETVLNAAGLPCETSEDYEKVTRVWTISTTLKVRQESLHAHEFYEWEVLAFDPFDKEWVDVARIEGPWHRLLRDVLYKELAYHGPLQRITQRWTVGEKP